MQKHYSSRILAKKETALLFSIRINNHLFHCWKILTSNQFVLIQESNNGAHLLPNQLLNLTEHQLKKYLNLYTKKLTDIDECLFFNEELWNKHMVAIRH